jgi:PAS domain S-box-containing protein
MTAGAELRVAVVAPYAELKHAVRAAVEELGFDVIVEECSDHAGGVRAATRALERGAEAIVSRGGTAMRIARALSVPVVEIEVSLYDILRCLHGLREHKGEIGITGFCNVVSGCDNLGDMLGVRVRQIVVESEEDARRKISAAVRGGVDMILGDALSVRLASTLGITGVLVTSGKEAVAKAIGEARRIAEVRVRERERSGLLRMVVENSPDGILAIGRDGRVTMFNPAAERIFDVKASAVVGASVKGVIGAASSSEASLFGDYIHPSDIPATLRAVSDLMNGGKRVDLSNRCRRPDGTYRWIEWQGVSSGDRMVFVTARDITDRKREMEEQASLKEQLFQSQKMETVGLLAGGVAHDFNNLLTPILGYSEMMMKGLPGGDPTRKKLEEIHRAADRARVLTMRLLAFGRKQVLRLNVVDVGEIVRGLEPVLRRTIREDIRIEIASGGPAPARVDRGQIEQVLLNLAVNAQDAMPGGGTLTIETGTVGIDASGASPRPEVPPGRYVTLSVSDTGVGMDEETQAHIFEPFFTTKELGKGTGLGLSTVYGIVTQHGGTVTVASAKELGSAFRILLPMAAEEAEGTAGAGTTADAGAAVGVEAVPSPAAPSPAGAGRAARGTGTVLVAEDNETVRTLACRILEDLGYTVLSGETPQRCIERADAHPGTIDLLLTDVIMPGMNGKELYDLLKRGRPELRALFMSGYPGEVIGRHGILDEGIDFLKKPFTPADLSRKIRGVLGN